MSVRSYQGLEKCHSCTHSALATTKNSETSPWFNSIDWSIGCFWFNLWDRTSENSNSSTHHSFPELRAKDKILML